MSQHVDAVIIGGGHHGLVSAAILADAGWDVVLLESRDRVGGAVTSRSDDGWITDEYSAIHPLAVASPVLQRLDLAAHGLRWARTETQLAHLVDADTPAAIVSADPAHTAARLDADHPGDGEAWLRLVEQWQRIKTPLLSALLTRWPPVRDPLTLVGRMGLSELNEFARFLLLPVHRMGSELFGGSAGRNLLLGNAVHADIPPDASGSGLFGWMMAMLAQDVGMPAPVGGAGQLAAALASRAQAAGAQLHLGTSATGIEVVSGRARAVRTSDGRRFVARRAIIADTSATALYRSLLPASATSALFQRRLDRFAWDLPTVKINLRLAAPIPWRDPAARGAAVLHLGHDVPSALRWSGEIESGLRPGRPFALAGQMTSVDPTRSPAGTETFWAYAHLGRGPYQSEDGRAMIAALDAMLEELAPGISGLVVGRYDQTPDAMAADDANLQWGAIGGGTMQLFQQAIWRPTPGIGGPRTGVEGLYLGSAAIHPGGGVHGACGYLAARAALMDARVPGLRRVATTVTKRLSG